MLIDAEEEWGSLGGMYFTTTLVQRESDIR